MPVCLHGDKHLPSCLHPTTPSLALKHMCFCSVAELFCESKHKAVTFYFIYYFIFGLTKHPMVARGQLEDQKWIL